MSPDTNILSPQYADDSSEQNSSHFYVHHTGTALIQPVVIEHHNATITTTTASLAANTATDSTLRHLKPHNASTPLVQSPVKRSSGFRSNTDMDDTISSCSTDSRGRDKTPSTSSEVVSGFYWHKNCLLPKQKNIPPGLTGRYEQVLQKFTEDCQNSNGIVNQLCYSLFQK